MYKGYFLEQEKLARAIDVLQELISHIGGVCVVWSCGISHWASHHQLRPWQRTAVAPSQRSQEVPSRSVEYFSDGIAWLHNKTQFPFLFVLWKRMSVQKIHMVIIH